MTNNTDKKIVRSRIKQLRDEMDSFERAEKSRLITERIVAHPFFADADVVLAYASFGSEVDTTGLCRETIQLGKKLFLPKVHGSEMSFYRVFDLSELIPGMMGIPEPDGTTEPFRIDAGQKVTVIFPGVAFDADCNRIGYGGGFYDKYFAKNHKLLERSIAPAFSCQIVERVQSDPHDLRPSVLIIE